MRSVCSTIRRVGVGHRSAPSSSCGAAARVRSRPLLPLGGGLQPGQAVGPHLLDERRRVAQPLAPPPVEAPVAVGAHVDQPGVGQHAEVLRDRRAAHRREVAGDLAGRQLVVAHEAQDGAAGRVGDRSQRLVHRTLLAARACAPRHRPRVCKQHLTQIGARRWTSSTPLEQHLRPRPRRHRRRAPRPVRRQDAVRRVDRARPARAHDRRRRRPRRRRRRTGARARSTLGADPAAQFDAAAASALAGVADPGRARPGRRRRARPDARPRPRRHQPARHRHPHLGPRHRHRATVGPARRSSRRLRSRPAGRSSPPSSGPAGSVPRFPHPPGATPTEALVAFLGRTP